MAKRYTGWVPTVTGNLSFSAIGVSKFPKKEYKCYRDIGDKKLTLVVQDRTTSDRIIPRKESPIGSFIFIALLISKKDTQHNENMGYVFVLPTIDFWRFEYLIKGFLSERLVDDFASHINSLVSALTTTEKAKKYVTETRVSLLRNGKLTIDVDDNVQEDIPGTLANQVFYFVRDITHIHQHHEATSDTILKAYNNGKLFKE